MTKLVIIGTGLAGYTLAREFRRRDKETDIVLITRDDGSSYSKPMLSNALSKDKHADELVMGDAAKMAADLNADILTNTHVISINPQEHSIEIERKIEIDQTSNKETISYDALVLANGANTINAAIEGNAANRVLSVNDLEDYRRFRNELNENKQAENKHGENKRVVIIGAGMIGCEFADDLSNVNADISIVNLSSQILGFMMPEQAAAILQERLSEQGVKWYLNNSVTHVESDPESTSSLIVTLKDGTELKSDIVLSAIGLRPSLSLAKDSGIDIDRGIKVNRYLQSSHKDIYALGDCAQVDDLNLPFVMPLMTCARALAATLAGEKTAVRYPAMPVALKTPCYPIVVCPAPRRVDGEWDVEVTEQGVCGLFKDSTGSVLGFVLMGERTKEKTVLAKQLPDWLP